MNNIDELPIRCTEAPGTNDILCGNGKVYFDHPGNQYFRELVNRYRKDFLGCVSSRRKKALTEMIVDAIQMLSPPGRFLKQDKKTKLWYDIGRSETLVKARQALQDGASTMSEEFSSAFNSFAQSGDDSSQSSTSVSEKVKFGVFHVVFSMNIWSRYSFDF